MSAARTEAAERLARSIDDRTATCAVVGLGFIGTTLMDALAAAGFEAHGIDRSTAAIERFCVHAGARAIAATRRWSAGADAEVLADASIVVVAVRAIVDRDGLADLESVASAAAMIRRHRRAARLVVLASTVPPGTTRRFATEWLVQDSTDDPEDSTFVVHAPERLSVGHDWRELRAIPHLVGGVGADATTVGARFLSCLCERVVPVASPEVTELSKLLENAFITIGVALAGEITKIANALGVAASDVCNAAATKRTGYHAFHPGPGVGGHCLPNDLRMLMAVSRGLGLPAPLLAGAAAVTAAQPGYVVDRLATLLVASGASTAAPLAGCRVLVVGVGFKIGSGDVAESPARDVVRLLWARGAHPVYLDSQVPELAVDDQLVPRVDAAALADGQYAAGVVLSGDRLLDPDRLRRAVGVLLDAGGGRALAGPLAGAAQL